MCLNITSFCQQLICFDWTPAAWLVFLWLHFTIVNPVQKGCEDLPCCLMIEMEQPSDFDIPFQSRYFTKLKQNLPSIHLCEQNAADRP
jgi:hypothetical protein